jgi:energy-coupling factor transporter ATP-binding protein EcfA2
MPGINSTLGAFLLDATLPATIAQHHERGGVMAKQNIQMELFEPTEEEEVASLEALTAFPRGAGESPSSIARLWLANMKGFSELEVTFSDFNVLVGPNNCGKSTVLQAIDLCFRLLAFHAEFRGGILARPKAGRRILDSMLPVATSEDFWFGGVTRAKNERVPVTVGMELSEGHQFQFEVRTLWGGLNSRMTKSPDDLPEDKARAILARRPTLIPYSVGVVTQEEYRAPARLEMLSVTGHRNEVLRNFIRELSVRNRSSFVSLQETLAKHFGASIADVVFSIERDQHVGVKYKDGDITHDIFSVGGGFLQVLQLLTYLYLQTPGIALLDEPDAHLHSSMQRLVVDILESLNKTERIQVIVATHSKEIINYVDASHILPISRGEKVAKSLESHASVLPILQDMGSIDNVDLAALVASKRCFFVEGKTDKKYFARFAARLGSTVFEGQSQVVSIPTEGVDNPERLISLEILEQVVGAKLSSVIIRDRDGLPEKFVQEIISVAKERKRNVVVLDRTQIENYVLIPSAIARVVREEMEKRGVPSEAMPSDADVVALLEDILDGLKDDTLDNTATHIQQHSAAYQSKHLDPKTLNQMARAYIDEEWKTLGGKIRIVEGKKALRNLRTRIQEDWKVAFTDVRVIEAMTEQEMPEEVGGIVRLLESL